MICDDEKWSVLRSIAVQAVLTGAGWFLIGLLAALLLRAIA